MKREILVVAKNYSSFANFVRTVGMEFSDFRYIDNPNSFSGIDLEIESLVKIKEWEKGPAFKGLPYKVSSMQKVFTFEFEKESIREFTEWVNVVRSKKEKRSC